MTPSVRAAWALLGTLDGLADRLRSAADALGDVADVEAGWLRGAADLVERGEPARRASRAEAVWLDELGPEARARKALLLSAWVEAAEGLRSAVHAHESERRGPLVDALFPVWRGPSLRRHADQALAAETDLQRRLASAYVTRRLAELATHSAVGPALETLAAAGAAWAAERDRPALAGAEGDQVRTRLLAVAGKSAHLLERVRWVVRAALTRRPDLMDSVFPKRTRAGSPGEGESTEQAGTPTSEDVEVAPDAPAPAASDAAPEVVPPQAGPPRISDAGAPDAAARKRRRSAEPAAPPRASRRKASARTDSPEAPAERDTSSRLPPSGQRVPAESPRGQGKPRGSRRRVSAEKATHDAPTGHGTSSRPSGQAVTADTPHGQGTPRVRRGRASAASAASAAHDARPVSRRRPPGPPAASEPEPRARGGGARRRSRPPRRS